jgi:hypothetical protein
MYLQSYHTRVSILAHKTALAWIYLLLRDGRRSAHLWALGWRHRTITWRRKRDPGAVCPTNPIPF